MNNNAGREDIVDKLHGALAAFRRERDDLHRKKELAVERLRLAKEERESMEKTIHSMQGKLHELNQSTSEESKREIADLQQEVERLHREAQFQHTELVAKKDKITRLHKQMKEDTQIREASLREAREATRKRREKVTGGEHTKVELTPAQQVEKIRKELRELANEPVWSKWPRLVEQKANAIMTEAGDIHRASESLRKLIVRYQAHFGADATERNDDQMQE